MSPWCDSRLATRPLAVWWSGGDETQPGNTSWTASRTIRTTPMLESPGMHKWSANNDRNGRHGILRVKKSSLPKVQIFTACVSASFNTACFLDVAFSGWVSNHSGHSGNLKSCGRNGVLHRVGTPRSKPWSEWCILGKPWVSLGWRMRHSEWSDVGLQGPDLRSRDRHFKIWDHIEAPGAGTSVYFKSWREMTVVKGGGEPQKEMIG
jgi:hypothetical protein